MRVVLLWDHFYHCSLCVEIAFLYNTGTLISWLPVLCLNHRGSLKISHRLLLPWSCLYTGILTPPQTAWDQARPSWKQTSKWYWHPVACRQFYLLNQDWEANAGTEARSDLTWSQDCHLESYLPVFMKNFIANTFLTPRGFPPLIHIMPSICLLTARNRLLPFKIVVIFTTNNLDLHITN